LSLGPRGGRGRIGERFDHRLWRTNPERDVDERAGH